MELSQRQIFHTLAEPAHRFEQDATAEFDPDIQEVFENFNFHTPLEPSEFSVARGWLFTCRICGGKSQNFSSQPKCNLCGFSHQNNRSEE